MSTLLCFGFGYSARHYVAGYGGRHHRVIATVRGAPPAPAPSAALRVSSLASDRSSECRMNLDPGPMSPK